MYFTLKSKEQVEAHAQTELKIKLTQKALKWFKNEIERGKKSEIKDFDLYIITALGLALDLDIISPTMYRQIQSEAESASK